MSVDVRGTCPLLKVHHMLASVQFYRDELGFVVVKASEPGEDPGLVLLQIHGAVLMLARACEPGQRPGARDAARVAAHADTEICFDCPDVDGTYDYLRMRGLDVGAPAVSPYGMKQLFLTDPDGYRLCFQCPAK